jgi:hypothetical protein
LVSGDIENRITSTNLEERRMFCEKVFAECTKVKKAKLLLPREETTRGLKTGIEVT